MLTRLIDVAIVAALAFGLAFGGHPLEGMLLAVGGAIVLGFMWASEGEP